MMYRMYITIGKIMKTNKKFALLYLLLALVIIVYCLTSAIQHISVDKKYYRQYVIKNNLDREVRLEKTQIFALYNSLIDYIDTGDEDLINETFNNREVLHMKDVHQLFELNKKLNLASKLVFYSFIISSIIKIVYKAKVKTLTGKDLDFYIEKYKTIKNFILIFVGVLLILSVFIATDFNKYFIKFHELFFNNDLWVLNPETDIMIRMLPEDYFMLMASRIAFSFISKLATIIIIIMGLAYLAKRRKYV